MRLGPIMLVCALAACAPSDMDEQVDANAVRMKAAANRPELIASTCEGSVCTGADFRVYRLNAGRIQPCYVATSMHGISLQCP